VRARERYREQMAELTAQVDLVLTPTLVSVAPPTGIGDLVLSDKLIQLTFPWNAIGAPALALPCGAAEDGLPASVQLIGRPGADAKVLAAGRLLERALGR
jgi:aspartyl-tRNA(Asn)/glutamyl-tRNA(Gln) amidotransferase subunit A